jgi:hypothetical protein
MEDTILKSEWIPHYQRLTIAGKHARLSVFEKPYYSGGRRKGDKKPLGRASDASPEDQEINRLKNARRRENKVKDLVRCNTSPWVKDEEMKRCNKFVTLTLKSRSADLSEGNKLLKGFQARLTRLIRKKHPGFSLKMLWVAEFQDSSRGCLHWHCLTNIPYVEPRWVITRGQSSTYAYLQKDGSYSPVVDGNTRVFDSFYEAKKARKSLSTAGLDITELKCKKILFDLASSWGNGFVDLSVVSSPKKAKAYISKLCYYLTKASQDDRFWGKRVYGYTHGNLETPVIIDNHWGVESYLEEKELWLGLVDEYFFECYLGFTEMYIFDLFLLDDVSFNAPLSFPQLEFSL